MTRAALSSTKLSLLRECPRAYRERYVEGRKGSAHAGMRRGSLVHLCLERAAKNRLREHTGDVEPVRTPAADLDELLGILDHYTNRASYPAVAVQEAREVLELAAPVDFSRVRHVEEEWLLTARDGRSATTKIDRVDYHDFYVDPERGAIGATVLVVDYKTSGDVRPRADLRDLPQTLLYLAAAKELYPDENVGIVYTYLRRGVSHAPIWWDEDLDRQARGSIEEALEELDRRTNGLDAWGEIAADPWPGRAGGWCTHCSYQAGCDEFAALLRSLDTQAPEPALLAIDPLLAEYRRARDAENANEARKKACGLELRTRIGAGLELAGEELRARIVTPVETLTPPDAAARTVAGLLREHGADAREQEELEAAILDEIAPRELSKKRLAALLAPLAPPVRAACKKALEELKIPIDAGSHVRVEKFKNAFAVGESDAGEEEAGE